MAYII